MQPTSLNKTFDTSLIDVQRSFSSTETDTSGSSGKENLKPPATSIPPNEVQTEHHSTPSDRYVSNDELYDQWASFYDTDGNVLQAVDDLQVKSMIPALVSLLLDQTNNTDTRGNTDQRVPWKVLDFGCGTGRNTVKLVQHSWAGEVHIEGLDASQAMLDVARRKCNQELASRSTGRSQLQREVKCSFSHLTLSSVSDIPAGILCAYDAVVSSLVLEHFPARSYFAVVAALLKRGAFALITNMHPSMGATTRAGFKTETGGRVRGISYVHTVETTLEAARAEGLDVVSFSTWNDGGSGNVQGVREVAVDASMVRNGQIGRRGGKWVGTHIWYGMILWKR